jgi:hypothetical protein
MQLDKKTMLILMVVAGLALLGLLAISFIPQNKKGQADEGVTQTISDGIAQEMAESKSDAYRGLTSTDDYFEQLGARMEADEDISLVSSSGSPAPVAPGSAAPTASSGDSSVDRVFGAPPASTSSASHTEPASGRRSSGGGGASRPMTEQERLDYDRRRAEMVRDVLTGGAAEETTAEEPKAEPLSIDLSAVGAVDGIISSLDDDEEDAAVQYEGSKRPFRCMFVRDQKLTSGQRVTLRLLEDYVEGGVRIPANTHLAAICKIGDRLELQVRSLEMNGRIIPLALNAYDTDGLQGIYCPETSAVKNSRAATNDAISTAGTTFGGLVGDIASMVIRTGATIAKSASGEVSVSVVSGYEFYLVKAERR